MIDLPQIDKNKIISFIKENDLDLTPVDSDIFKFHVQSDDKMKFFFYEYNNECVLVKYDSSKDKPGESAYEYYYYKTLPQLLEQLAVYDRSIPRSFWEFTTESIEIGFDNINYKDDWYSEIIDNNWIVEDTGTYKYVTYTNSDYKPELKSPSNTLHEVSPINQISYTKVDKLNIEIHPVSCMEGRESYYLKLLCNNEEVFKEYINYKVIKKKGLKMLLETIFKSLEPFKIK